MTKFAAIKTYLENFYIIAFTHKTIAIEALGKLHIEESKLAERLTDLKKKSNVEELMYLSTCNRVEFLIHTTQQVNKEFLKNFFSHFDSTWNKKDAEWAATAGYVYHDEEALRHLFSVASSIDSLVVGEREIITQVRNAYENCNKLGLTGDLIRLVIKKTIETAKHIYTHTHISKKPVSVVSLAYRRLKELNVKIDSRFLIIGSGVTNTNMSKYLKKHGFKNFTVFNRTIEKAEKLASELNCKALPLSEIKNYKAGFDVILTCTGSQDIIITKEIYSSLVGKDKDRKIVIDLAVPNDLDPEILKSYDINLIAVNNLQEVAKKNLEERESELVACVTIIEEHVAEFRQILKTRKVELAMSEVPTMVKEIRDRAYNTVFAKDIEQLDEQSKETLDKILSYVEKKYISLPMKMAREILIKD